MSDQQNLLNVFNLLRAAKKCCPIDSYVYLRLDENTKSVIIRWTWKMCGLSYHYEQFISEYNLFPSKTPDVIIACHLSEAKCKIDDCISRVKEDLNENSRP